MGRYRRTVSFPNPIAPFQPNAAAKATKKSYHVRSVSLPCGRTHPLIPQLRGEITELRAWERARDINRAGSGWLNDGLAGLKGILDSLDDVLQLPQTQDALASNTDVVEKLLEDFIRFVDVYEVFRASMLGLKQEISAAQVAIRRKDDLKLALYVKSHKKIAHEIGRLISTVGSIAEQPALPCAGAIADYKDDLELGHVIRDVHRLTVSVSEVIFSGIAGSFGPSRKPVWAGFGLGRKLSKDEEGVEEFRNVIGGIESLLELRKKKNNNSEEVKMGVLKKMQELEDCVGEMERGSERVFRSLISTRVSLLNILTHA